MLSDPPQWLLGIEAIGGRSTGIDRAGMADKAGQLTRLGGMATIGMPVDGDTREWRNWQTRRI